MAGIKRRIRRRCFDLLYRLWPQGYLELAKQPYQKTNPTYLKQAFDRLDESLWPVILWSQAQKYVQEGGANAYPNSRGLEDAVFQDAATRHLTPGIIRDSLASFRQQGQTGLENLSTTEGTRKLEELIAPVLLRDHRLAGVLDREDLAQEARLRLQEVATDPTVEWEVGQDWAPGRIWPTKTFIRDVLGRLTARQYGTDRQIARVTDPIGEDADLADPRADRAFEETNSRMAVNDLLVKLPPKQREAVEIQLQALELGISLEEMSRRLGKDPKKIRENFKAVQRRFPR